MKIRTTAHVEVAAPLDQVFAYATNPESNPLWKNPKAHSRGAFTCALTSGGPIGMGSTWLQRMGKSRAALRETRFVVTEYEPGLTFGFEGAVVRAGAAGSPGNRISGRFRFEQRDGTTLVRYEEVLHNPTNAIALVFALPLLPIVIPLVLWGTKKGLNNAMGRLKGLIEAGGDSTS